MFQTMKSQKYPTAFLVRYSLARISHQFSAANAHLPESAALRAEKVFDVLSSTPARFVPRAPLG
jgi:hypothetical protein